MHDRSPVLEHEKEEITITTHPETHELVIPENVEPEKSHCRKIVTTSAQVTLAIIGLGAGALYFGPAQTCADIDQCGKWLADMTSRGLAVGVLTAGGLDFSGGAAYMAGESAEATINFIARQKSLAAKIGMGSFIFVFATAQNVPLLLASLRTSSAVWQTVLTVGGSAPGSVFGSIHITEDVIPYYYSLAKKYTSMMHHRITESCMPLTETEKLQWDRITHYRKQFSTFMEQADARYRYVLENAESIDTEGFKDPIGFLFSKNVWPKNQTRLSSNVHKFGALTGLLLAANFSAGGISNTYHLLGKYLPFSPLVSATTALFSASGIYANIRLTIAGVTSILDTFADLLQGKPIHSLLFRLRPKTTMLVTGASLAASALSYAVITVLYLNEFESNLKNPTPLQTTGMIGAMAGIDIYHFASLFHLYHLLFSRLTPSEKEKFLLGVEHALERMKYMTEAQWIKLITENPEKFAAYGVTLFPQDADVEAQKVITPNEESPLNGSQPRSSMFSRLGAWCGTMFSRSRHEDDFVDLEAGKGNYRQLP